LRATILREELRWPHVCDGTCWNDPLAKLYNTRGIPDTYLLDTLGRIAAKNTHADKIGSPINSLLQRP
jgi:hypothetical protein